MMRRAARRQMLAVLSAGIAILAVSATAHAEVNEYGLATVEAELSTAQAGAHPDFTTKFRLREDPSTPVDANGQHGPYARTKDVVVQLPPGLVGNPAAFPKCTTVQFLTEGQPQGGCPVDSQVGSTLVQLYPEETPFARPVYLLKPAPGEVARLGFYALIYPVVVDVRLRSGSDYGLTATIENAPARAILLAATTTLWGVPADPVHNPLRGTPNPEGESPELSSGLARTPFLTNPTSCGPASVSISVDSYPQPGSFSSMTAPLPEITGCERLAFDPRVTTLPTSRAAGSPTGLDVNLEIPQSEQPEALASSEMRDAKVSLPPGMTLSAAAADGLGACSAAQVQLHSDDPAQCPEDARIGSARFVSPALEAPLEGEIFQRTPESGNLFRVWLVSHELGVNLKVPGDIHVDRRTGQIESAFLDNPQLPVEEIALHFKGGSNGVLANPSECGAYQTSYEFSGWAGSAARGITPMTLDEQCSRPAFHPAMEAGVPSPTAGFASPFSFTLVRGDGEPNVEVLETRLPLGELARLAGVSVCSATDASAGSCPSGSQIGSLTVAVGPGDRPLFLPQPGKAPTAVYLGGPYRGAPYSLVFKVPAQAGPFDLGTVVTRAAVYVDPETAQVTIKTDALPQILEGVPTPYQRIHVDVDRPHFMVTPTDCREASVTGTAFSSLGEAAPLGSRFQVGGCGDLAFEPRLGLRLFGKRQRGANPRLRAVVTMPTSNQANIARASVALPHSEFLDQGHIRTVCTRVQYAAHKCPADSIYGFAKAWSPLLHEPLQGPVYLRSSNHELPDLVASLDGQIHIDLDGRIDSVHGGIRTTFAAVPDAPVSRFVLNMRGGEKGLLENSRNVCQGENRAVAKFTAHNGRVAKSKPRMLVKCGKRRRPARHHRRRG